MSREAHVQFCERVRGKLPRPTHSGAGGTVTYGTADDTNKYPTVGGATQSHDSNGNLTGDGTWTFGYNTENQLTSASKTGVSASYVYDVYGRQTQKTVGSAKTRFIYAGLQRIADYDGVSGSLVSRYVYGTGLDEPLIEVSSGGTLTYFHHDRVGSIIARTDATGAVTQKYKYSPFGESAALTGTSFGFQGQRYDSESGLYYCKARYLNPATGRFLQPDPIGLAGGFNLYTFVHNDPLDKVDPLGLIDMVPRWILEGGIQLVNLGNPVAEALGIISTILGGGGGAPSPAAGGMDGGAVIAPPLIGGLAKVTDGAKNPKPTTGGGGGKSTGPLTPNQMWPGIVQNWNGGPSQITQSGGGGGHVGFGIIAPAQVSIAEGTQIAWDPWNGQGFFESDADFKLRLIREAQELQWRELSGVLKPLVSDKTFTGPNGTYILQINPRYSAFNWMTTAGTIQTTPQLPGWHPPMELGANPANFDGGVIHDH